MGDVWAADASQPAGRWSQSQSWYERLYQIRRWTVFPRGGHFAAAEEPDLLAGDIADFFAALR